MSASAGTARIFREKDRLMYYLDSEFVAAMP
jgi:hypothetical protein